MKKALCLILVLVLSFVLFACGGNTTTTPPTTANSPNSPATSPVDSSPNAGSEYPWNPDNIGNHTFILAHGFVESSMTSQQYNEFAVKVSELSGGKMFVDQKIGGTLLLDTETLDAVRMGTVDFIHSKGSFVSGTITDLSPITIAGYYGGDNWLGFVEDLRPVMSGIYADYGIKYLGALNDNYSVIANTIKPITSPEDVIGMSFRASGTWLSKTVEAWGGAATVISLADLPDAFNRGTVDGVMTSWSVVVPFSIYEVTRYITTTTMVEGWAALVMNLDRWNELNSDEQALIQYAASYFQEYSKELGEKFAAEYLDMLKNSDRNEVISLTPAQEAEFIDRAFSLFPQIEVEEKLSEKGFELIRLLKEANGLS